MISQKLSLAHKFIYILVEITYLKRYFQVKFFRQYDHYEQSQKIHSRFIFVHCPFALKIPEMTTMQ